MGPEHTQDQLERFHEFALARLENGGRSLTLEELFDEWRLKNPTEEELRQNLQAVSASLRDFDAGERGREAKEFCRDFKLKHGAK